MLSALLPIDTPLLWTTDLSPLGVSIVFNVLFTAMEHVCYEWRTNVDYFLVKVINVIIFYSLNFIGY